MKGELILLKKFAGDALSPITRKTNSFIKRSIAKRGQLKTGAGIALGLAVTSLGPLKRFRRDLLISAAYSAAEGILDFLAQDDENVG